jgi:hypothetical protein
MLSTVFLYSSFCRYLSLFRRSVIIVANGWQMSTRVVKRKFNLQTAGEIIKGSGF